MKFPTNNTKKRANPQAIKKSNYPTVSLNKPIKNSRNLIQQQRANALPAQRSHLKTNRVN